MPQRSKQHFFGSFFNPTVPEMTKKEEETDDKKETETRKLKLQNLLETDLM